MDTKINFASTLCIFVLLFVSKGIDCLRLLSIEVPTHRQRGENAVLTCKFDMEGDILYSVKWYKNDHEFYRFVPNDNPKLQVFEQRGIKVDRLKSGKERVVLKHLNLDSQGTYKCEVSGEGPSFRTKSDSDHMVVVVPPQRAEIVDAKPKYKVGDTVNVTCISYRSKPAASLNWKINGEDVSQFYGDLVSRSNYNNYEIETRIRQGERGVLETYKGMRSRRPQLRAELHEYQPVIERGKGRNSMETSRLGLSFVVPPSFYPAGLTLECSASIGSVYWQSFQEKIPISPKDQAVSDPWWSRSSDSAKSQIAGSLLIVAASFFAFLA